MISSEPENTFDDCLKRNPRRSLSTILWCSYRHTSNTTCIISSTSNKHASFRQGTCYLFGFFVCLFVFSKRKGKRKKNHFHVSSSFFLTKNETRTKTTSPSRPDRRRKVKRNRPRFPWWLKPSEVRSNPCRVERLPHPILAQTTFTKWVSIDALLIPKSMQD